MNARLDALMDELAARHGNDAAFLASVRPMAERILDPGTPEDARPALLELLAETCERDVAVKRNCEKAVNGLQQWFSNLERTIRRVDDRP